MLLILLLASLWPCLNCQNLTTILSTPLTTQAATTFLPTTLTSLLTTSASISSNTATQSTQSTTKITNPPTIIPSNLPTIPALPTLAPLPSQTTRQPGIYPSQQTITANQVPGATASQLRILIGLMIPSNSSESAGYDNTASAMTRLSGNMKNVLKQLPLDTLLI
ncbi:hypothetical protein M3Y97_00006000 [Aphelenchoides bicaudatus]|nr:hypothetical protein M3Y97_00006000 [Aphelenchoides bicaudatus]